MPSSGSQVIPSATKLKCSVYNPGVRPVLSGTLKRAVSPGLIWLVGVLARLFRSVTLPSMALARPADSQGSLPPGDLKGRSAVNGTIGTQAYGVRTAGRPGGPTGIFYRQVSGQRATLSHPGRILTEGLGYNLRVVGRYGHLDLERAGVIFGEPGDAFHYRTDVQRVRSHREWWHIQAHGELGYLAGLDRLLRWVGHVPVDTREAIGGDPRPGPAVDE